MSAAGYQKWIPSVVLALTFSAGLMSAESAATRTIAIKAGRVFTMTGPPMERGVILMRGGKIIAVGPSLEIPNGAQVLDATSRVLIPGLIAARTSLGDSADSEENVTPQSRAIDSFDFHGDYDRLLEAGITSAYISTGDRRLLGGQSAVVKLAGATPASRTLRGECDLRVALGAASESLPALFRPPLPPTTDNPILPAQPQMGASLASQVALLRQILVDAKGVSPSVGGSLGTVAKCLAEGGRLRIRANRLAELRTAIDISRSHGVQIALEGATEGYLLAADIAKSKLPVIVTSPIRIGAPMDGDLSRASALGKPSRKNMAILTGAGVHAALAPADDADLPELTMLAASEVSQGASRDAALKSVTSYAAEALGVERRVGTLAPGRDADIAILNGDPLDSRTTVEATLVNGLFAFRRKPPPPAPNTLAIRAGRILTATRGEIRNGVIVVRDGKIVEVHRGGLTPSGAKVIDAPNGVVIPGLIDAHSYLGLHSDSETPALQLPSVPSGSASGKTRLLNSLAPADSAYRDALRQGVTTVLLSPPTSGAVCGQAALLKTPECAGHGPVCAHRVVKEIAAICFNIQGGTPRMAQPWTFRDLFQRARDYLQRRTKYEQDMRDWERDRKEAASQMRPAPPEPAEVQLDEDLAPLSGLFKKQIPALVHAERADEISNALKMFADEAGLPVVLIGASDAFRMTDEIRRRGASAALSPSLLHRDKGRTVNRLKAVSDCGVNSVLQSSAVSGAETLRLTAAYAVRHGLDPGDALRALTINAARALMVESRIGSIEAGKDADLVILTGDPFDAASRVSKVLVNGKVVYDGK